MRLSGQILAVAAAAALLMTIGAIPARAESVTVHDRKGDAWRMEDTRGGIEFHRAGAKGNADVRRVLVNHTTHAIKVTLKYTELRRTAQGQTGGDVAIAYAGGDFALLDFTMRADGTDLKTTLTTSDDDLLACGDMEARARFGRDQVLLEVPRDCLGDPRWIRAKVGTRRFAESIFLDAVGTTRPPGLDDRFTPRLTPGSPK